MNAVKKYVMSIKQKVLHLYSKFSWIDRFTGFYRNMSIKKKIPVFFSIQIIIALIFFGYFSYRTSEKIIKDKAINYTLDILSSIKIRLTDYIDSLNSISQDILYDKTVYNILTNINSDNDALTNYENEMQVNNILKRIILTRTEIESICFLLNNGIYYYSDYNGRRIGVHSVYPIEEIYQAARQGHGKTVWYINSENGVVKHVFFARTVYSQDTLEEAGLLFFLVKTDFFENLYSGLDTKDLTNISIVSSQGEIILNKNDRDSFWYDKDLIKMIYKNNGAVLDKKSKMLISFVSLENPDWSIISHINFKDLFKDIYKLRKFIFIIGSIFVFVLLVLSIFASMDIIIPIKNLVLAMENSKKNNEMDKVEVNRGDELGLLCESFNQMSSRINYLVKWVYKEQITRKEAEMKALQSQINPHFLFNTLESINWMAQLSNVPEISNVISALASLIEAGIGRDDSLVTLKEELEYVHNYILILQFRFEDKIIFKEEIDPDVMSIKIPRLLIQPLVENAVYHGIEKTRQNGIIMIKAFVLDDILTVEIIDNGVGMDSDVLENLKQRLSVSDNSFFQELDKNTKKSIGIENVSRRIKLFYGDSYGLNIESKKGIYSKVTIHIPAKSDYNNGNIRQD